MQWFYAVSPWDPEGFLSVRFREAVGCMGPFNEHKIQ